MSATAPSQLSRSANACESCRRRKVKCSGKHPCASCIRQRIECKFNSAGRRGYSDTYVQGLLATIKHQEELLREKSATSPQNGIKDNRSNSGDLVLSQDMLEETTLGPIISGPSTTEVLPISPVTELAPGPAFESRVKSLLRDHAESRHSQSPPDNTTHISGSSTDHITSHWRTSSELVEGMPPPNLLSKTRSYELFDSFISLMGVNQHFLDPRTFSDKLTLLYQNDSARAKQMETIWFTQYLLVMAMAKLIGGCPSQVPQNLPGNAYFAEAMKRLPPLHQLGTYGITAVEILCLVTLYLQWCDRRHDAYLFIGTAVRLAIALGCSLPYDEQEGLPSEICHRVRVWWTAYMLDRRLSAALGLPMAVDDRQLQADLPRPSAGFQPPLPLIINIRIARATGEIMTSFYGNTAISQPELVQKIQSTLLTLHETGKSIPNTLAVDFSEPNIKVSRTGASLYLMLFQAMILCIRPIILQSVKEKVQFAKENCQPAPVAPMIARLCHSCQDAAIKSIKILSSLQKQQSIALFGYFDTDATFSAAFILLMMGFVKNNDPQRPPEGLAEAAEVLRYLSDAGNKAAEQRLNDLKQFCYHVWSPNEMSEEWKWLAPTTILGLPTSTPAINTTPPSVMNGSSQTQRNKTEETPQMHSFWPEEWDGWFNEAAASTTSNDPGNVMLDFDGSGDLQLDLNPEANGIYSSFNDPNLPLTGVDEMDWAEMEKIFRFRGI